MEFKYEMLEINEDFKDLKNMVITQKKTGTYKTVTKYERLPADVIAANTAQFKKDLAAARAAGLPLPKPPSQYKFNEYYTPVEKVEMFGLYLLNYVHALIHEFGYSYLGKENGEYRFHFIRPDWLHANKVRYDFFEEVVTIKQVDGKWGVYRENNMPKLYKIYYVGGSTLWLTDEEFSARSGIPLEEVKKTVSSVFLIEERDPANDICNIFNGIEKNGDVYSSQVFINGLVAEFFELASLRTSFNKTGMDYIVEWRLYNDSPVGTTSSLTSGNFGESFKRRFLKSDPNGKSIKIVPVDGQEAVYDIEKNELTYDSLREHALLEFYIEFMPAQGKNECFSAYYNIKTGKLVQTLRG